MNSGPMTKVFTYDAREWFKDAGFPFARLHDVEYPYGSGEFVDVPYIFKDFNADEVKKTINSVLPTSILKDALRSAVR